MNVEMVVVGPAPSDAATVPLAAAACASLAARAPTACSTSWASCTEPSTESHRLNAAGFAAAAAAAEAGGNEAASAASSAATTKRTPTWRWPPPPGHAIPGKKGLSPLFGSESSAGRARNRGRARRKYASVQSSRPPARARLVREMTRVGGRRARVTTQKKRERVALPPTRPKSKDKRMNGGVRVSGKDKAVCG